MNEKLFDIETPEPSAVLWRYMDFTKFISMLDSSTLNFTRVDALDDKFEGRFTQADYEVMEQGAESQEDKLQMEMMKDELDAVRKKFYVNCWHENVGETVFMWSHYAPRGDGVAIRTDFQSLCNSIISNNHVFFGKVKYFDNTEISLVPERATLPFLMKRREFEGEKEVRAYFKRTSSKANNTAWGVRLSILVKEIVVDPSAPDWVVGLVESMASKYDLDNPVTRSSLATEPKS